MPPKIWLVIVVFVLRLCVNVSSITEVDVLITFKSNLNDKDNKLQSWDTATSPCTWTFVACDDHGSITRVDLGNAGLSGSLVPQLGELIYLQVLGLYTNNISGRIPPELGNLNSLVNLDLYENSLSDGIPDTLGQLSKLKFLRLNNNNLSGRIPVSLTKISSLQALDLSNNQLSGQVPTNGSFSLFTLISFKNNPELCGAAVGRRCPGGPPLPHPSLLPPTAANGSAGSSSKGAISGGVAAGATLLFVAPAIFFAWWRRRRLLEAYFDVPAAEDSKVYLGQLKKFSLRELQVATDGFGKRNILGRGGFGKVYKGRLLDGSLVAIKRLNEERRSGGELQFQTEVEIISMAVHRNLLGLLGFCMTSTERLLVYPYMENGSVASRLREFEAVVGDFGLAKLMNYKDTHVTTAVRGTIGHIAPEYLSTGKSSEKTDVFGYGIMLLELITGQRAFDLARLANDDEFMLLDWVKALLNAGKVELLVDPDLKANYESVELEQLIQVALLCTQGSPIDRPKMAEVVCMLEGDGLAERWEEWQNVQVVHIQKVEFVTNRNDSWSKDSLDDLHAVELSGPR
ncbi:hypothetical protein O6H91_13G065400 [Diphasiastrum complanatum]|uniref:Uncharacterized protein n=1 Tax=Diphasiastrum complanatum TaxID=34168 RepID=A0ACC2BVI5_DIPCM|nr:hypothetical protein O6H91_13G065400 [Diphasiastrum complanatum]